MIIILYHYIKTLINFLCRWKLNIKNFIRWQQILQAELIRNHDLFIKLIKNKNKNIYLKSKNAYDIPF